jgi:Family of unknown function (DUF5677)
MNDETTKNIHKTIEERATPLQKLQRKGKLLEGPFKKLQNVSFSSWVNEIIPEVLWSVLIVSTFSRESALSLFREIIRRIIEHKDALGKGRLDHSKLALLNQKTFNLLFAPILANQGARDALIPLLVLEALPDKERWSNLLPKADLSQAWNKLAAAVANSYDHQSQAATDCRWLKVMTAIAKDELRLPEGSEQLGQYINYLHQGDMRKVRPGIRAAEMILRAGVADDDPPSNWASEFWAEGWRRSICLPVNPDEGAKTEDQSTLFEQVVQIENQLTHHFLNTVENTDVNPRHDGAFGLVFYILHLFAFSLKGLVGRTTQGRLTLRSAVEALINLTLLAKRDDPTIWLQYRNYGTGQAKLGFLKFHEEDAPSFVTRELLEEIANSDMWLEFQDIKLGAWSDKNLRTMAEESGLKSFNDRYYDTLSGYAHANWAAVRHDAFGICANPLHRFHRIPMPPRFLSDDSVPDLIKIANLALDQLTKLYPPFKPRLRHKDK